MLYDPQNAQCSLLVVPLLMGESFYSSLMGNMVVQYIEYFIHNVTFDLKTEKSLTGLLVVATVFPFQEIVVAMTTQ